ncbi:MAG: S41 family peptidase [Planctomycetes bacterium]|nr:S41 family peptidase [Planctomycetota bacterium]
MIRERFVRLLCFLFLLGSPVDFPDTPAAKRAQDYLATFNVGSDEKMRDFESKNRAAASLARTPMDERMHVYRDLFDRTGGFEVTRIVHSSTSEIALEATEKKSGQSILLTFDVEEKEPHGLVSIQIEPARNSGSATSSKPLDATMRTAIVDGIAKALDEAYIFPEVAKKMIASIREQARAGRYDDLTDARVFASRLTTDLQAVSHDKHLRVRGPDRPDNPYLRGPSMDASSEKDWMNNDFERVERLAGNIGYVKLNGLRPGPAAERTAAGAMAFLENSSALIFDLRDNGGGAPEMIAFILSYLFEKPTLLNTFYDRVQNVTTESSTSADVPGRRFAESVPVYVLTSNHTFSGAEEFAYDLLNLKRATIVGETTGGGAHPVMPRPLPHDFQVLVPFARAINPITKTNWEGVGVEPNVKVSADKALLVAERAALETVLRATTDGEKKREIEDALRTVKRTLEQ